MLIYTILGGLWKPLHTCKGLTEACEVEEASSGHCEQLTQKNQEGDGGEDHREDHEGLDRLQPVWERWSHNECKTLTER